MADESARGHDRGAPALFDTQGRMMDERTREQLRGLFEAFYVWIIKHKAWLQER